MKPAEIERALLKRLKSMGIDDRHVAPLVKDIFNIFFLNPQATMIQINERLRFLGWIDVELDYHTFSLAKESLQR